MHTDAEDSKSASNREENRETQVESMVSGNSPCLTRRSGVFYKCDSEIEMPL